MSYPLSPYSYLQIAQALPRPSPAQCERFLEHIATARRWFELLPIAGDVPFTLFLNPHAGREPARKSAGVGAERAAARYREAFGHLDYAAPVARDLGALTGGDLGLAEKDTYYV